MECSRVRVRVTGSGPTKGMPELSAARQRGIKQLAGHCQRAQNAGVCPPLLLCAPLACMGLCANQLCPTLHKVGGSILEHAERVTALAEAGDDLVTDDCLCSSLWQARAQLWPP
eukprot:364547-Chlamydomonas_euryale.AAC.6